MTDFLTTLPWGWYALLLIVAVALIALANHYEDHRLPKARAALDEDSEVARLDDIWELPTFKEPAA